MDIDLKQIADKLTQRDSTLAVLVTHGSQSAYSIHDVHGSPLNPHPHDEELRKLANLRPYLVKADRETFRLLVGGHTTIMVIVEDGVTVALASVTGHAIAKSLNRMVGRAIAAARKSARVAA